WSRTFLLRIEQPCVSVAADIQKRDHTAAVSGEERASHSRCRVLAIRHPTIDRLQGFLVQIGKNDLLLTLVSLPGPECEPPGVWRPWILVQGKLLPVLAPRPFPDLPRLAVSVETVEGVLSHIVQKEVAFALELVVGYFPGHLLRGREAAGVVEVIDLMGRKRARF